MGSSKRKDLEERIKIYTDFREEGLTRAELCEKYNLTYSVINNILYNSLSMN